MLVIFNDYIGYIPQLYFIRIVLLYFVEFDAKQDYFRVEFYRSGQVCRIFQTVERLDLSSSSNEADRGHPLETDCGGSARRQQSEPSSRGSRLEVVRALPNLGGIESRGSLSGGATRSTVPPSFRQNEREREGERPERSSANSGFSSLVATRPSSFRSIDPP